MTGWISELVQAMLDTVLDTLTTATLAVLDWVLGLLSATVFTSPDVTALPQVAYLSGVARAIAAACMVLVVCVAGVLVMTQGGVQDRYAIKEMLPRMLVGFLASTMADPIVRVSITAANVLTAALTADGFASPQTFTQLRQAVGGATAGPSEALAVLLLREVAVFLLVLLVITWLGRLAVLIVAGATAPLALFCHALPQTELVARLWWRAVLSCLGVQVLQAVTLHLAVATLLSGQASLPALGIPQDPTGLLNLLITCFLLWLVVRIPAWVAKVTGGPVSRAPTVLTSFVRVAVMQRALGAAGLRPGRRRTPAAAARAGTGGAGPRAPSPHFHQHHNRHEHVHLHAPRGGSPGTRAPRPAPYWAGDLTPSARAHPGRPPAAVQARRALGAAPARR